jgi:nicotinamide-nucleotide amidase
VSLRSAIVTVGEELLSGATVDSNAAWLGRALSHLGIPVRQRFTVGDRDDRIEAAVLEALELAELVVVTGGLGPTEDDRTRPAVARALGRPLDRDPALVEALEARFRGRGHATLPPANLRQADVPRGGHALPNPRGTAPGLWIPAEGGRVVVLLPGVPREMRALFDAVEHRVREQFAERLEPVHSQTLHTTGIPESVLAPRIEEALGGLETRRGVEVAYLPELTGVDLRLSVAERDGAGAEALAEALRLVEPVIRPYRFEAPETGDLVEAVARQLGERGLRLATAESCTGGGVSARLTARPGASAWFLGGVVAYDNAVKTEVLGVDPMVLERHGAVSEPVACQMAEGVLRQTGADCAISITGIAGPGGAVEGKPVGTVWWAVAFRELGTDVAQTGVRVRAASAVFPGDREAVRIRAGQAALRDLHLQLQERA